MEGVIGVLSPCRLSEETSWEKLVRQRQTEGRESVTVEADKGRNAWAPTSTTATLGGDPSLQTNSDAPSLAQLGQLWCDWEGVTVHKGTGMRGHNVQAGFAKA